MFKNKNTASMVSYIQAFAICGMLLTLSCQSKHTKLVRGNFQSVTVDKGNIEVLEPAEGTAQPSSKVILLSPAPSIVKKIYKEPGQRVKQGDAIIMLDTKGVESSIEQINDQLAVKYNNLEKTRLSARATKADLAYNSETKKLKIASIKSTIEDQKQLLDVGGISQAKFDKTQQELVLAQKDLKLVQEKNVIKLAQLATEEKGLLLQISMQEKDLALKKELLQKMIVKAPSDGIILSVEAKAGEKIQGEKVLVNMSDLSRLKIAASVESKRKRMIKTGKRAYVIVDGERFPGRIGSVMPQIENGKLRFSIHLSDDLDVKLIPNQRVDVEIVRIGKYKVNRLKVGGSITDKNDNELLVVKGDSAILKTVKLGLVTDQYIEVKEGLEEGDEVIISSDFQLQKLPAYYIENN
ncbi:efflux RND transporter periplasmic adaptor subunit [Saccharicrinis aurantiacus]|uniref:efflux RND transporter periplasmic adaptor subunit n=1 Tax=Saccharicrinis aurantiacus TaxID=1849719 RepID=UPI000838D38B|nr:efflux RND transporter periplasmic adaptor subunit [Saccharicrinis aurantiacus]